MKPHKRNRRPFRGRYANEVFVIISVSNTWTREELRKQVHDAICHKHGRLIDKSSFYRAKTNIIKINEKKQ